MGSLALSFRPYGGPGDEDRGDPDSSDRPRLSVVRDGADGAGAGARTRVLLVEDDPSMRLLCTFNLEAEGFEVATATNGADGAAKAVAERFDLILLDVMLPDLGGFEVLERISGVIDTPVVFLSARASAEDVERGRAAGAVDYVAKPFDPIGLGPRLREDLDVLARSGPDGVRRLRFT